MPTYEYRCRNGHTFELFQRMSDPPPGTCEVCGAKPVERVLFPVAVHFKGSGFYSTDYGRGGRTREDGADKDGKPSVTESGKGSDEKPGASSSDSTGPASGQSASDRKKGSGSSGKKAAGA